MRRRDWPERLAAFVGARRRMPFAWGVNDCWMNAADWVLEATGVDHAASYRGTYTTEIGALRLVAEAGSMRALCPLPSKPKGFAQRGDLVLACMEGRETAGIVNGDGTYLAPGPDGLVARPMSEVLDVMAV